MAIVVSLDRFIDQMDLPNEEWAAYLNRQTGEFVTRTDDDVLELEEEETEPLEGDALERDLVDDEPEPATDWHASLPAAHAALESDDYLLLPTRFEIQEWSIMDRFCTTIPDQTTREVLLGAIRGSGAFRFFNETIHRLGIEQNWYSYRREALETVAIDWLKKHGIEYEQRAQLEEIGRTGLIG